MSTLSYYFKKLDILGQEISFENEKHFKYRTIQGSIFSVMIFIVCLVLGFLFGSEVWERKKPIVTTSKEFIPESKIMLNELLFILGFFYGDQTAFMNSHEYLDYNFRILEISTERVYKELKKGKMALCQNKLKEFNISTEYIEPVISSYGPIAMCIDFNNEDYILNEFTSIGSVSVFVTVDYCSKAIRSDCKFDPETIMYQKESSLFGGIIYFDYYTDSANFDEPVKKQIRGDENKFSFGTSVTKTYGFTKNVFISDNGWLLEKKEEIAYLNLSESKTDFSFSQKNIYTVHLSSPRIRLKDYRQYTKVQEIFAKIGGVANVCILFFRFLTLHYFRFKYLIFFIPKFFRKI